MTRAPIRIRAFILGIVLVLLLAPALAGGAAWLIERDHQQAGIQHRLNTAVAYLTSRRTEVQRQATIQGFANLVDRLDLLAQLSLIEKPPPGRSRLYVSPALSPALQKQEAARQSTVGKPGTTPATVTAQPNGSWVHERRQIAFGTHRARGFLAADLYYQPASRATPALVGLLTGVFVLLAGLAVAIWLAGRWMVTPLTRLSAQVDKVAGGDLAIAVPRSRIGEVANIAQAVEGMTGALGDAAQKRAEADEARRFLVTSIAHDLRTPLFALRGHLQAIRSRLGNPAVHLQRAEARADALERLIGNLFAYTRDDYTQPTPHLETVPVTDLLHEVTASLEHTTRLRHNSFELDGDQTLAVIVDRERIKRALTNILDNAVRYSPADAPVHVTWATVNEASVEITVRDHGPGIDTDLLPHIFEPGIRGTPASGAPNQGAGLGLTIAKRLLEHQHATLTARNQPTGGAAISLQLHRAPSADPALSSVQATRHAAKETPQTAESATTRNPRQPRKP